MSLVSFLSVLVLGFISNYFFQTSKVLGIMINAERVHNNTFQEGVEEFYKYQSSGEARLLDSAVVMINSANQMAYHFAIIDQLLRLPREKWTDILYESYKEAYAYDRNNAVLRGEQIGLFVAVK